MAGFLYRTRTRCSLCQMFSHSVTTGEASNYVSHGNNVPYKYVKLRSIAIAVLTSGRTHIDSTERGVSSDCIGAIVRVLFLALP
jgi:hypothetical protein